MSRQHVFSLFKKEMLELSRHLGMLAPVGIVAVLALLLPFTIAIFIPIWVSHPLSEDADLVRISRSLESADLGVEATVQLFIFQQFVLLFLLLPITGAMALAAHGIVGEKQARTLEPLLATPASTLDLLVAKALGALVPTLAISGGTFLLYLIGIAWLAESGVLASLVNLRTAALLFLVGPAAALVSLQMALVISSRVNDARTAQQFGVLIVLPLTAALVAQFTGVLWFSPLALTLTGLGLLGIWVLLSLLSVVVFDREAILTRWR